MKKILTMCLAVLLLATSASARDWKCISKNYEELTPGATSTGITAGLLISEGRHPREAFISVQDNPINFTIDGTTPTDDGGTDAGHPAVAGSWFTITGYEDIKAFRCIDKNNGSASRANITLCY